MPIPADPGGAKRFDIAVTAGDSGGVTVRIISRPPEHPGDRQRPSFRGEVASAIKRLPDGNPLPPYFHHEVEVSGSNASYHEVEVDEDSNPVSGHHFVPARERAPTHDPDGNMLSDGHWLYAWDAENRLVSVVTAPGLDAAIPKRRVDMAYDYMGRPHLFRPANLRRAAGSGFSPHSQGFDGLRALQFGIAVGPG